MWRGVFAGLVAVGLIAGCASTSSSTSTQEAAPVAGEPAKEPPAQLAGPMPAPAPARPAPAPAAAPAPTAEAQPDAWVYNSATEIRRFQDPVILADTLIAAEQAIRSPDTPPEQLQGWAWTQQQAYRDLQANPGWRDTVRSRLPQGLLSAFDANTGARQQLSELNTPFQQLPKWRIIPALPVDELLGYYQQFGAEFGVPWEYLAAIHYVETSVGRVRGESVGGALGPMQFIPSTWEAYGEGDIWNNRDAIRAAARYLAASGAPGNMPKALYAYNPNQQYVNGVEAYASVIRENSRAYLGFYNWRVFVTRTDGQDVILPEGYGS